MIVGVTYGEQRHHWKQRLNPKVDLDAAVLAHIQGFNKAFKKISTRSKSLGVCFELLRDSAVRFCL